MAKTAYSYGISHGTIALKESQAESWPGLVSVNRDPDEEFETKRFLEGVPLPVRARVGSVYGTISAFSMPSELLEKRGNGLATKRRSPVFDFTYRTTTNTSYRIHIFYNVKLAPGNKVYEWNNPTVNDFEFSTKPERVDGWNPSAYVILDKELCDPELWVEIEERIYGSYSWDPYIPPLKFFIDLLGIQAALIVTDLGDDIYEIDAPDNVLRFLGDSIFELDHEKVVLLPNQEYTVESS